MTTEQLRAEVAAPQLRAMPLGLPRYDVGRDPVGYVRRLYRAGHPRMASLRPTRWSSVDVWGHGDPGSGVWDCLAAGAVAAAAARGFEVSDASPVLARGLDARTRRSVADCDAAYEALLDVLAQAPQIRSHPAHQFGWRPPSTLLVDPPGPLTSEWLHRVHAGWAGSMAGSAFGAPLRGSSGDAIRARWGIVNRYVDTPTRPADPFLVHASLVDAADRHRSGPNALELAALWRNDDVHDIDLHAVVTTLRAGVLPPRSAWIHNPLPDSTAAQRRAVALGLLAPCAVGEVARRATLDASVTHTGGGVDGAVATALLVSLAIAHRNPRRLIREVAAHLAVLPSAFAADFRACVDLCSRILDPEVARAELLGRYEDHYWRQVVPNTAALIHALWFGEGDFTATMAQLASSGLDVLTNACTAGAVLGLLNGEIPSWWSSPLSGDDRPADRGGRVIDDLTLQTQRIVETARR